MGAKLLMAEVPALGASSPAPQATLVVGGGHTAPVRPNKRHRDMASPKSSTSRKPAPTGAADRRTQFCRQFILFFELFFLKFPFFRFLKQDEKYKSRRRRKKCSYSSISYESQQQVDIAPSKPTERIVSSSNLSPHSVAKCKQSPKITFSLKFVLLVILAANLGPLNGRQLIQSASANLNYYQDEQMSPNQQQAEALQQQQQSMAPEAQPLIFIPLSERGSGDGYSRSSSSSSSFVSSTESNAQLQQNNDISSSLIEAKCWNNYENDNDCKHLNFITAPSGQSQQQQQQQSGTSGQDDDSIITPVVIFESSSTIDPSNELGPQHGPFIFMAPPYLSTSAPSAPRDSANKQQVPLARHQTPPPTANDMYSAPPASATVLPPAPERPATRPSATGTGLFVATPQPKKAPKTTTLGRRCRDENDADCDEPDDGDSPNEKGSESDDDEPDDPDTSAGRDTVPNGHQAAGESDAGHLNEIGSGEGPADDNDDSTDDGDDAGDNSIESSGNNSADSASRAPHLLEVTTAQSSGQAPGIGEMASDNYGRSGTTLPASDERSTRAEIEVVVHSTLPPSFPKQPAANTDDNLNGGTTQQLRETTTTSLPDDTFTSQPIFPSTTSTSRPDPVAEKPPHSLNGDSSQASGNDVDQESASQETTTISEPDLYTFKSIPIPMEQEPAARPFANNLDKLTGNIGNNSNVASYEQASSQHDTGSRRPASAKLPADFASWTTRKPLHPANFMPVHQDEPPTPAAAPIPSSSSSKHVTRGSDMLPMMLLYASIVILVTTTLIFVIMAFVFWRRNTARRRALLQKANLLNGGRPPNQLVGSMSHASQLLHGANNHQHHLQQPGLLSTYAPGKGLTTGKVTTSLVKPATGSDSVANVAADEDDDGTGHLLGGYNQTNSDEQLIEDNSLVGNGRGRQDQPVARPHGQTGDHGNRLNGNQSSSWSTEDPATSSDSQRTQDSQQQLVQSNGPGPEQQQALRSQYPNSLSDGRQNSSSISDSQCSPDPSAHHQPTMALNHECHPQQDLDHAVGYQPPRGQTAPIPHQVPSDGMGQAPLKMHYVQRGQAPAPVMQNGIKHPVRFINSGGSFESIQQQPSQHVGFIPNEQAQQLPYDPACEPVPHLVQQQQRLSPQHFMNHNNMNLQHQQAISPQKIAMNPLATLGRRYPPGMGLNRNIYSEDSSSFMTTSPSLARTSSSSSFAFNLATANHHHQLPPPIRPKPLVDASGRVINDYTQTNYAANNTNGAPPVFGRRDRSEAWYV